MSEVDLQSLPPLLTADIQRTLPDGKPTDALSDWEQFQQNWMTTNVVNLDTKLTEVSLHLDGPGGLSGKVTEISSVVENEDGSLTAGKLTTVEATTNGHTGKISDLSEVVANPDGTLTAGRLNTIALDLGTTAGHVSDLVEVVANPDGSITAGRLTSVETTANGASGLISDLTTSVDGIKVQKVLKANLNGATGGYEFAGVQNVDGTGATFSMSFTLNQFQLTDPSYNGGLPGNVFSYSTASGAFNFNVPVTIKNKEIGVDQVNKLIYLPLQSDVVFTAGTNQVWTFQQQTFTTEANCEVEITTDWPMDYNKSTLSNNIFWVEVWLNGSATGRIHDYLFNTATAAVQHFGHNTADPSATQAWRPQAKTRFFLNPGTYTLELRVNVSAGGVTIKAGSTTFYSIYKRTGDA